MTCHVGEGIIVCDGRSGGYLVGNASCPWCCLQGAEVRVLYVWIFGGYGGRDLICGACGQEWSDDDDRRLIGTSEEDREQNIALVAATPDPKCWDCQDTGDRSALWAMPESDLCDCEAGRALAGEVKP